MRAGGRGRMLLLILCMIVLLHGVMLCALHGDAQGTGQGMYAAMQPPLKVFGALYDAERIILTGTAEKIKTGSALPILHSETPPSAGYAEAAAGEPEIAAGEPNAEPMTDDAGWVMIGEFTVTAYCPCVKCCGKWANPESPRTATGTRAAEGRTVGADFATIAAGSEICIEGVGVRTVEDRPAAWIVERYGGKILDLYFETHEDALAFGRRTALVYCKEPPMEETS